MQESKNHKRRNTRSFKAQFTVPHCLMYFSYILIYSVFSATSRSCESSLMYFIRKLIFFTQALPAHSGPRPLSQFRNHFSQTGGLLGRMTRPSQGRYLNTGQHKHRINAYTHQTSMPWVGLEPTITESKRAKTAHALDRAATVTGSYWYRVRQHIMK
jgi:hypothetical protein